jgi:hypothetical protein
MNKTIVLVAFAAGMLGSQVSVIGSAFGYVMDIFELRTRSTVTWAPVASFRPLVDGQVMAVDAMPKGQAIEHPDNGYAWFDACDSDIMDNNQSVVCARMGIKSDRVEFGSRNFNGAQAKDVYIVRDRQVIAKFTEGGLQVFGTVTANSFQQIE